MIDPKIRQEINKLTDKTNKGDLKNYLKQNEFKLRDYIDGLIANGTPLKRYSPQNRLFYIEDLPLGDLLAYAKNRST